MIVMEDILVEGPYSRDECVVIHVVQYPTAQNALHIVCLNSYVYEYDFPFQLTPFGAQGWTDNLPTKHYRCIVPKTFIRDHFKCFKAWNQGERIIIHKNELNQCYAFYVSEWYWVQPGDVIYETIDPVLGIKFFE